MDSSMSFKNENKFLVYLLIATGNWHLGLDDLVASRKCRLFFKVYAVLLNLVFIVSITSILAYTLFGEEPSRQKSMLNLFVNLAALQFISCLLFFVARRQKFRQFIDLWDNSFKGDPFPKQNRLTFHAEQGKNKKIFFAMVLALVFSTFAYYPKYLAGYMRDLNGKRSLPFHVMFPFDATKSPGYEMVVILQMGKSLAWTCKIVGFAMVYYTLVSQQTAKMKHLAFRLAKLFDPESVVAPTMSLPMEREDGPPLTAWGRRAGRRIVPETQIDLPVEYRRLYPRALRRIVRNTLLAMKDPSHELVKQRLRLWVQHHQQAIRTARELNNLFSRVLMEKILLIPLLLSQLIFIVFNEESDLAGISFLTAVGFIFFCFFELLLFFHFGDNLEAAHGLLSEATSSVKWAEMRCVPVIGSSLKIIEMGCEIPMTIKAMGFFPINTSMFVAVIKRAYTAFWVIVELQRH